MSTGELLDAALALLRTRWRPLLGIGLLVAAAEQAVLHPLRQAAGTGVISIPRDGRVAEFWLLISVGYGTEALAIALLGAVAAGAALPALVGRPITRPARPSRTARMVSVGVVTVAVGALCGLAAAAFLLPWWLVYPLLGLATPAVVVDRLGPGRALLRSAGLSLRSGLRVGVIRLLGYLGWLLVRLVLFAGMAAGLALLGGGVWESFVPVLSWLLVNAVAYPVLGCLDAVLHLETRMRVEGLDIALGRALRRGEALEPALAVPR